MRFHFNESRQPVKHFGRKIVLLGIVAIVAASVGAGWLVLKNRHDDGAPLKVLGGRPQEFTLGEAVTLTLSGQGFDETTRVALTLDSTNRGATVASLESWATVERVRVVGRRAYLASSNFGFQIVDIADPRHPRVAGAEKMLFKAAWDLEIVDDLVYVADVQEGLLILDVADPGNVRKVGHFPGGGKKTWGVALVSSTVALLAQGKDGVAVIDVSDPATPRALSRIETSGFSWNVAVWGSLIFVADGNGGMHILDLSDPAEARFLGHFASGGHVWSVVVEDGVAYVAAGTNGMEVVDVSDPTRPRQMSRLDAEGDVRAVRVADDRAYLAAGAAGLVTVDIADRHRPRISGIADTPGSVRGLDLAGDYAFLASGVGGLQIVDRKKIRPRQGLLHIPARGPVTALARKGETLFLAKWGQGLNVYRIDSMTGATLADAVPLGFFVHDAVFLGDYLLLATGSTGLQVYRYEESQKLTWVAGIPGLGDARRVCLANRGRIALVATGASGVAVVDLTDPSAPVLRTTLLDLGEVVDVAVWGSRAAVADGDGRLHLFDGSDPAAFSEVARLDLPGRLGSMTVAGQTLYVTGADAGLYVVDVRDPVAPGLVGTLLPGQRGSWVATRGDQLYLAADESRTTSVLSVWDARAPRDLRLTGQVPIEGAIASACASDGMIYLSLFNKTLVTVDVDEPALAHIVALSRGGRHFQTMVCRQGKVWGFGSPVSVRVFDVGTPQAPQALALAMENFGDVLGVYPHAGALFLLDQASGLHAFDLEAPGGPQLLSSLGFQEPLSAWWTAGDTAYLFGRKGRAWTVDLGDPQRLRKIAETALGEAVTAAVVRGTTAFLAAGKAGLRIYDFADPNNPRRLAAYALAWPRGEFADARDLKLAGDLCLIANGRDGLLLLDVSEPARPRPVGHLPVPGYLRRIWVRETLAFLELSNEGGLLVDFSEPARPMRVGMVEATSGVQEVLFDDDSIWLAQREGGVMVVPMPVFGKRLLRQGGTLLKVALPGPPMAGSYTLNVFSGNGSVSLPGFVTIE